MYEAPIGGDNLLTQTTLMLKNIPVKFNQQLMLKLIDEKFAGRYDYFYLPKDLKTQGSVGFAFINFLHPVCVLRFYREFHGVFWSALIDGCNSPKKCQIVYAAQQGLKEIRAELRGKEIMKKREQAVRPFFVKKKPTDLSGLVK